jgi:uncharacterized SAM-binding protein YcdF (DUF218 family)
MRRILLVVCVIFVVGCVVSSALALYIFEYGQNDRAEHADVIIILGAGVRRDGKPLPAHWRRIQHGISLYKEGYAPLMLCTGGHTQGRPLSEAEVCADYARQGGVPAGAILTEETSTSTEENAIEAGKVMVQAGLKTAILVTDNFHLFRAELLFREYGLTVYLSPAQSTSGPLTLWTSLTSTYREVAALTWEVFKTVLRLPYTSSPW